MFVLLCCFVVSFFLQICKFRIFPPKYFFDAGAVQEFMLMELKFSPADSYYNTAIILNWMNKWLPMNSQLAGGLVFWAFSIIPCGWIVLRYMKNTWEHYLLIACYAVMLPVFVWNTQKEAIQFIFFLLLAIIAYFIKSENYTVDVLLVSLLFLWGLLFRMYYIITAAVAAFFMILGRFPWNQCPPKKRKAILIGMIGFVLVLLVLMSVFIPQAVAQLFGGRMQVNSVRGNDPNANTIILDLVDNPNGRLSLYLFNYIVAAVRMMFPFELLFKGVQYLPFVLFQLFSTVLLGRAIIRFLYGNLWREPEKRFLYILLSWYLVSFLFEPDFGSFIRHQAAAFPIAFPTYTSAQY